MGERGWVPFSDGSLCIYVFCLYSRLASLASDPYHRNTADALSQRWACLRVPFHVTRCVCVPYCRYVSLDREMEEISCVWRNAKEHLNHHHHHHHVRRRDIYMNYQLTSYTLRTIITEPAYLSRSPWHPKG